MNWLRLLGTLMIFWTFIFPISALNAHCILPFKYLTPTDISVLSLFVPPFPSAPASSPAFLLSSVFDIPSPLFSFSVGPASFNVTARLRTATPEDACSTLTSPTSESFSNTIVAIYDSASSIGFCLPNDRAKRVQNSGAIGAINVESSALEGFGYSVTEAGNSIRRVYSEHNEVHIPVVDMLNTDYNSAVGVLSRCAANFALVYPSITANFTSVYSFPSDYTAWTVDSSPLELWVTLSPTANHWLDFYNSFVWFFFTKIVLTGLNAFGALWSASKLYRFYKRSRYISWNGVFMRCYRYMPCSALSERPGQAATAHRRIFSGSVGEQRSGEVELRPLGSASNIVANAQTGHRSAPSLVLPPTPLLQAIDEDKRPAADPTSAVVLAPLSLKRLNSASLRLPTPTATTPTVSPRIEVEEKASSVDTSVVDGSGSGVVIVGTAPVVLDLKSHKTGSVAVQINVDATPVLGSRTTGDSRTHVSHQSTSFNHPVVPLASTLTAFSSSSDSSSAQAMPSAALSSASSSPHKSPVSRVPSVKAGRPAKSGVSSGGGTFAGTSLRGVRSESGGVHDFDASHDNSRAHSYLFAKVCLSLEIIGCVIRAVYCAIDFNFSEGIIENTAAQVLLSLPFSFQLLSVTMTTFMWRAVLYSESVLDGRAWFIERKRMLVSVTLIALTAELLFSVARGLGALNILIAALNVLLYIIFYLTAAAYFLHASWAVTKVMKTLVSSTLYSANEEARKSKLRNIQKMNFRTTAMGFFLCWWIVSAIIYGSPPSGGVIQLLNWIGVSVYLASSVVSLLTVSMFNPAGGTL